jgi:hypothetical protein
MTGAAAWYAELLDLALLALALSLGSAGLLGTALVLYSGPQSDFSDPTRLPIAPGHGSWPSGAARAIAKERAK